MYRFDPVDPLPKGFAVGCLVIKNDLRDMW